MSAASACCRANEDQSGHDLRMTGERAQALAAVQVPDADRFVAFTTRLRFRCSLGQVQRKRETNKGR